MKYMPAPLVCLAGALTLCAAGSAGAQKVYRCEPDGRVVYQQSPCNDGKVVDASDPRTAEQRKAAQAVARSEAKAAEKFDRDNQPASAPKAAKPPRAPASAASQAKGEAANKAPEKLPAYLPLVKPAPAAPKASS